jgi:hypothetical protein
MTTHDKLSLILKNLKTQPKKLTDFNWIVCHKDKKNFYPSQIGISQEEYLSVLSSSAYSMPIKKSAVKTKLKKLLKKYDTAMTN